MIKVGIIGAGPAGLTAAYKLSSQGAHVTVFETTDLPGGLSRSFELWGQIVDLGPHRFFSRDPRVNQLWLEVVEKDFRMVDRLTRIYYNKRFFHYPLKPTNALWNLGFLTSLLCVLSYLRQKVFPQRVDSNSFEGWVVERFGRKLYKIFFKSYSEKLWGIDCTDLDSDFAAQRIKKFSLFEAIKNSLGLAKVEHKTLADTFAYPINGTGMVYMRMANSIQKNGGKIHYNSVVTKLVHENLKVQTIELSNGKQFQFDHVISTMPITNLIQGLGCESTKVNKAKETLKFRNTILVFLEIEGDDHFDDQWLYIHSSDLDVGRITNFSNWVPEINKDSPNTIMVLEYWGNNDDALWLKDDDSLVEKASTELKKTGLIKDAPVLNGLVKKIPKSYPIYSKGYKENLHIVYAYLKEFKNLSVIGRYGAFKYNNQDHSILMGLLAAENIQSNNENNLWDVNSDYEFQESCRITESGLVQT